MAERRTAIDLLRRMADSLQGDGALAAAWPAGRGQFLAVLRRDRRQHPLERIRSADSRAAPKLRRQTLRRPGGVTGAAGPGAAPVPGFRHRTRVFLPVRKLHDATAMFKA